MQQNRPWSRCWTRLITTLSRVQNPYSVQSSPLHFSCQIDDRKASIRATMAFHRCTYASQFAAFHSVSNNHRELADDGKNGGSASLHYFIEYSCAAFCKCKFKLLIFRASSSDLAPCILFHSSNSIYGLWTPTHYWCGTDDRVSAALGLGNAQPSQIGHYLT